MERRSVPAYVKIKGVWTRVGTADLAVANPYDMKINVDANHETTKAALEALMQARASGVGFGTEPPEPHDDEYKPSKPQQPVIHFDPPRPPSEIGLMDLQRRSGRERWPI